jgi:hypothetical protein
VERAEISLDIGKERVRRLDRKRPTLASPSKNNPVRKRGPVIQSLQPVSAARHLSREVASIESDCASSLESGGRLSRSRSARSAQSLC